MVGQPSSCKEGRLLATSTAASTGDPTIFLSADLSQDGRWLFLRVEHGRPRYGIDLDDSVIPQEAGLNERAVSFTKGCYVGQETVARLHYRGKPNRHLRGVRLSGPARAGDVLRFGDREVGHLGSVADSPRLGWIALALVRREAPVGSSVSVGDGVTAEIGGVERGQGAAELPEGGARGAEDHGLGHVDSQLPVVERGRTV